MKTKIFNLLLKIGVPCEVKGFDSVLMAIELLLEDFDKYSSVTKELYPTIAKAQNSTPQRIERRIRHAIERTLEKGEWEIIYDFFGTHGALTNSKFLFTIVKRIQLGDY